MNQPIQNPLLPSVDPAKLPELKCKACGSIYFENAMMFKSFSAIQSLNGKAGEIIIGVPLCVECGTPLGQEPVKPA